MNVLSRLASVIGYPQTVPADTVDFTFKVDDGEVRALDLEKRLVLMREISREEDDLPKLASYAAGRMLREDAVLHWDGRSGSAVLTQEIPASATSYEMKVSFEAFADSCDWWLARTASKPVDSSLTTAKGQHDDPIDNQANFHVDGGIAGFRVGCICIGDRRAVREETSVEEFRIHAHRQADANTFGS